MATVLITKTHKANLELYEIANYLRIKGWVLSGAAIFTKNGVSLNIENLGAQMTIDAIAKVYKTDTHTIFKAIKGL